MSVATPLLQPIPVHPEYSMRRFTVDEYHRLAATGVFDEQDSIELLEGWPVEKMTKSPRQDACITRIERLLRQVLPTGWMIRVQCAITTGGHHLGDSEPEPDLAIVRFKADDYAFAHPTFGDVGVVIEVADTSLAKDRRKARIYTAAGVECYWIINLNSDEIESFTAPQADAADAAYSQRQILTGDEPLILCLDGVQVARFPSHNLIPKVT